MAVKDQAEAHIDLAIATFAEVARDKAASPAARVAAANALLDRAVGRAPQPLQHSGEIASNIARLPAPVDNIDEWMTTATKALT